jgi:type 1 glutamine amidotransferase
MKKCAAMICAGFSFLALYGQEISPDQKQQVDLAVPSKTPVKPGRTRRMLVSNLSMRDGRPFRGSSFAAIPVANYAFEQMGKRTGAYEAVFSDDIEMFRPDKLKQFDAICFLNTVGVLFDDPDLRQSLLAFIAGGKGFVGIHDAIATFVQYPKYDQWPAFGQMLGATENGGHPWNGEVMTIQVDDPASPLNAMFHGQEFQIADQAFQFQEPLLRDHLHVLLSIDAVKTAPSARGHLLPVRAQDKDFPVSWVRSYGNGRVFFCSLGHGAAVYANRLVLEHFLAGIQYALGDLKADSTSSAELAPRNKAPVKK